MCALHESRQRAHPHRSDRERVRIAQVHVIAPPGEKVWPYVDFEYSSRQAEIEADLESGCRESNSRR